MRYLVDTGISSQQDANAKTRAWMLQHYLQIAISSITVAEIAQGIGALPAGRKRTRLANMLSELVTEYVVIGFGLTEARKWGEYVNAVGRPLPILDSLIAATALANDLEVVTNNERHFPRVPTVNPLTA